MLKALESYVDDNGVGRDDLALIVGDTFMRDLAREPSRTLARVSEAISELHAAGLVWRYAHDDDQLLYISFWETVQRVDKPQDGRKPRPDGTFNYKDSEIRESSKNIREPSRALAPVTEEQGNRGTEEQNSPAPAVLVTESDFSEVWSHWPKKVERKAALDQFRRAVKNVPFDDLKAFVIEFGDAYAATTEKRFVPALDVWLRGERWTDELPTMPGAKPVSTIRPADEWRYR